MYSVSRSVSCLPHLNLSASVQGLQMGIPLTFLHASSSGAAQTASSLLRSSLRHLLLQHFEALMDSQGLFRQSPGNATGSYAGSEFPFLGVIPYSPPVPGNLQGKASKKSTPVAHCHHHSLCIWLPRVMLGPYPKKNIWTVF